MSKYVYYYDRLEYLYWVDFSGDAIFYDDKNKRFLEVSFKNKLELNKGKYVLWQSNAVNIFGRNALDDFTLINRETNEPYNVIDEERKDEIFLNIAITILFYLWLFIIIGFSR